MPPCGASVRNPSAKGRTPRTIVAAALYFGVVFALGFALAFPRELLLKPQLGQTGAVLLELPVMLIASWLVCGHLIRRFAVPPSPVARLAMGGGALGLLLGAELMLSVLFFDRTLAEHLHTYRELASQLGLAAQCVFGLMPLIRMRAQANHSPSERA